MYWKRNWWMSCVVGSQHAIRMRGHASLVVSGGRTPLGLFRRLSQADIDFSNLSVYLCDERWVDIDHPDSNARQVKTVFMQGAAAQVRVFTDVCGGCRG